jgi:uncharacterized protein (TIGR02145 family)
VQFGLRSHLSFIGFENIKTSRIISFELKYMKKKNKIWIYLLIVMGVLLMLTNSCKRPKFNSGLTYGTITDQNGNVYKTITIGTQTWMAENLRTTKFNDGTDIPLVKDKNTWSNLKTSGCCFYNNNPINKSTYGVLYNWYTVNTGKLCPTGWHVPTNDEWQTLIDYLGGKIMAGGKLKEASMRHWDKPNTSATNESGFTGLPGGVRYGDSGTFVFVGEFGYWWSSERYDTYNAWYVDLYYENSLFLDSYGNKNTGFSVRCVRDKI